jgi:dynein heavy chain, axonemal
MAHLGIKSSSDDPLNMQDTRIIPKTSTNLNEIVNAHKRAVVALDPETRVEEMQYEPPVMPSFFPLEYFDDRTYETRTAKEWMESNGGEPVDARSLWHFGDGTSEWKDVQVLELNEADESFIIEWVHNAKRKKASRLNVCFQEEDLKRHEERRQQALDNRARIEAIMRYERTIDSMPTDKQLQLTPNQFHSVIQRIGMRVSGEQLRRNQELVEDVLHHYSRCINKMDFDHVNPEQIATRVADPIEAHGLEELPVQLLKIPGQGVISTVELVVSDGDEGSLVQALEQQSDFIMTMRKVELGLAWAPSHLLTALFSFQNQIRGLSATSFLWDCSECVELSVFKQKHVACWTKASESIKVGMMESMADSLLLAYGHEETLAPVGQQMSEEQRQRYVRIVELANKMLRDALRDAVTRDIKKYVECLESYLRLKQPHQAAHEEAGPVDVGIAGPENEAANVAAGVDAVPSVESISGLDASAQGAPAAEASELVASDKAAPERVPSDKAALERFPSDQPAPERVPSDKAAPERLPSDKAAVERVPLASHAAVAAAGEQAQQAPGDGGSWYMEPETLPADLTLGILAKKEPVFLIELRYHKEGKLTLEPGMNEVEQVAVSVITELVQATEKIASFQLEIINARASQSHLLPCKGKDFEDFQRDAVARTRAAVIDNSFACNALVQEFEGYPHLIETQIEAYVQNWQESAHTIKQTNDEIRRFTTAADQVAGRFATDMVLRMFKSQNGKTKRILAEKAATLQNLMLTNLASEIREQNQSMCEQFAKVLAKLEETPENPEELAVLQAYVKDCDVEVEELALEISKARAKLDMLEDFGFDVTVNDFQLYWTAFGKPKEVEISRQAAIPRQEDDKMRFMVKLQSFSTDFQKELASIDADINKFFTYFDLEQADEYHGQVMMLDQRLKEAQESSVVVNEREKLFDFPVSDFSEIGSMVTTFKPYADLWTTAAEFQKCYPIWMGGDFGKLEAESIDTNVTNWWKFAWRAEKTFDGKKEPQSVCTTLKEKLDEFKPNLPIITALRNPGVKDRHWLRLSEEIGHEVMPDGNLTLRNLLEIGILQHENYIVSLSEQAAKEYSFERTLDKMKSEWRELLFEFSAYKDTGTFVLKGIEDTVMLLDDQIVKVQAMRGSPYAKAMEQVVIDWANKLVYMQDVLEEWLKCQKTWLYLEPIFASPDIMRQMPTEGRRFQKVDQVWRTTMQTGADAPSVLTVMNIENLKTSFVEANKTLDMVQKGLNDYLETKRGAFPRFFFLSNDELLDILSETKDPRRVVPHMPKAFEGIAGVEMRGKTPEEQSQGDKMLDILAMVSGEGEVVPLSSNAPVEPDAERNRGNVERWLLEMETSMRTTLKEVGRAAIIEYPKAVRTDFVQNWCGMIVLAADCLFWTKDVEDSMAAKGHAGLKDVLSKMQTELSDIVALVRGDLGRQARLIIGAMVVLDVHNKDVVVMLVENGVSTKNEFDWNSQLRYYQENIGGQQNLMCRMMNASLPYSYEYLGNSMRLVVTPLTDRCYRTLMGALHLSLGGAPEGPAGTGKTETVKDLSKAVAKQCVVFNCSDGLDYLAMAKFFKGLASCGAWACFDEFNRIDLEVLSVVAQQILSLTDGLRRGLARIMFEGSDIPLIKGFSSFITMNPGYAGRSELPDNLKALFRPCAMMVPDYAMISEICLYSYGFTDARDLAQKLVKSLQISSEQLSSQVHYDFGMRAVKSILTAAGLLKRAFLDSQEDLLVLRAINDVNLPKFTDADLPLFKGITSDLFLGLTVPEPDYEILIDGMKKACGELMDKKPTAMSVSSFKTHAMNVQPTPNLLGKCIQLYETVTVRHSLMVVGLALSMKTSVFKVLEYGMCNVEDKSRFEDVLMYSLNPKSITIDQIYGNFDPVSREWVEGIGASLVRKSAQMDSEPELKVKRKWILFDGPVDAIWIENMNTVMDDNKKLCLNSGEIIKLTGTMTMMFEPEDLQAASPATVSRNGMVLMEPHMLEWTSIMQSWFELLPPSLAGSKDKFQALFEHYVPPLLRLVKKECKEPVETKNTELFMSLIKLMNSHLKEFREDEACAKLSAADVAKRVDGSFLISLIWSFGCTSDDKGRAKFNDELRELFTAEGAPKLTAPLPDKNTVYDWAWEGKDMKFKSWLDTVPQFSIPDKAQFQDILVPTLDTIRYGYILETQLRNDYPVLFCGDTGTGKSVMVKDKLMKHMGENFVSHFMNFSANSKANQTQDIIDGKVDKRRKGVFGPPLGKKLVVFVDDLNMPNKEAYGAQPPIEILRQMLHWGGWWDRREIEWRQMVDTVYAAAMGLPGGGKTHITCRYTRWYNIVIVTPFDDEGMTRIFTTIFGWWCQNQLPSVSMNAINGPVVAATLEVFKNVSAGLLPSPAKSHYTFNLRDIAKVVQGIMSVDPASIGGAEEVFRLWIHESQRIFMDRLIDNTDKDWFFKMQGEVVQKLFKKPMNGVIGEGADGKGLLMYADFVKAGKKAEDEFENRKYSQLYDLNEAMGIVGEFLDDFNQVSKKPMQLVLFGYVVEHVCRLCRVFRQPAGHALLVGVGGSGRQSLTRLAASIGEFVLFGIEITKSYDRTAWFEDLKSVFKKAGCENKRTVFLFTDSQIVMETMLEDLNNVLNTGSVPNLFPQDEVMQILDAVNNRAKAVGRNQTPTDTFEFFIDECKKNLHMVICMSPIGSGLRDRLRSFPSLVNCCTIDWFFPWPEDGLIAVARQSLPSLGLEPAVAESVIDQCMQFQVQAQTLTKRYQAEMRKFNYVTPTSYLELISTFKSLLNVKKEEVGGQKRRYEVGLAKILSCADNVSKMEEELTALQPVLVVKTKEVEDLIVVLDKESADAAIVKTKVEAEASVAKTEADKVGVEKAQCEAELAEALPALDAALSALKSLTKGDITEMKAMKTPPSGVKLVMQGVCILFDKKPAKVAAPDGKGKIDDWWAPSKEVLGDTKFMDNLLNFDKDNISPAAIKLIAVLTVMPEFQPAAVEKQSKAATGICKWVRAMEIYDRVAKVVEPKRIALKKAEEDLSVMMASLKEKQDALALVLAKIAKLEADFKAANDEKVSLANQVDMCEKKLVRAGKLISGLGGERARWTENVKTLGEELANTLGDVLVSSAVVAYLGVFSAEYRGVYVEEAIVEVKKKGIPCSSVISLEKVLGNPVQIRDWNLAGLPRDSLSTDNAIIMSKSRRWPLMIDPQGQANRWIRNMEAPKQLGVYKLSQSDFVRNISTCVTYGRPVLLENVGETIDSILEPLLTKAIYKSGGSMVVNIGDPVEYHENFMLYLTTKLPSPHYAPEVSTKVVLINFTITQTGLTDQLLGKTVEVERNDLEQERQRLVIQNAGFKKQLAEIENKILKMLSEAGGDILEDEELINTLSASKVTSNEIGVALESAEKTEANINETRMKYTPYPERGALLFFCVAELRNIEPMYQYSLDWFVNLYIAAMNDSNKNVANEAERVAILIDFFTYSLYRNVCRSLFEKDKLLYSFLVCSRLLLEQQKIRLDELKFSLSGVGGVITKPLPKPADWIPDRTWTEVQNASMIPSFSALPDQFKNNNTEWKVIYDSNDPASLPMPGDADSYTSFQKMAIMRCLRPDKVVPVVQHIVIDEMGQRFVEPPPFDLKMSYEDSSPVSPLIFILSPGADPNAALIAFADSFGVKLDSLSLGQGQGPIASRMIDDALDRGSWVVLQNCHLSPSWMGALEAKVEAFDMERASPTFRLWLTSYPSDKFPVTILQNGVKMTLQPPKGVRANMINTYVNLEESYFSTCPHPRQLKKLHFGLAFFHALAQERRKFGPLGFNIPYEFTESDLKICQTQVQMFLTEFENVPWEALRYTAGETNYGGRVTDKYDRRTTAFILLDYYNPECLKDEYKYSESGKYAAPPGDPSIAETMDHIRNFPLYEQPEVFGLHENANITCARNETYSLFESMLLLMPSGGGGGGGGGGGQSSESILEALATKMLETMPMQSDFFRMGLPFKVDEVGELYPTDYNESMNTVLTQECLRFNRVIVVLRSTLQQLVKAVQGLIVMSNELEAVANSFLINQIPASLLAKSYPSLKPLGSYFDDFMKRLTFLQTWIDEGPPPVFWLSGFYFTQSFLTGVLQNYARKHTVAIDTLAWDFKVLLDKPAAKAEDGCYTEGMFIDGGAWDRTANILTEQKPKVLFDTLPTMQLVPILAKEVKLEAGDYPIPLYKTSARKGTLSTTGHSTNFVMQMVVPSKKTEAHWVKRGVALLSQLDD